MSILAQIFENENSLHNLRKFVSINGKNRYGLKLNKNKIKLKKLSAPIKFKKYLIVGRNKIQIFNPGLQVFWQVN